MLYCTFDDESQFFLRIYLCFDQHFTILCTNYYFLLKMNVVFSKILTFLDNTLLFEAESILGHRGSILCHWAGGLKSTPRGLKLTPRGSKSTPR